MAQIIKRDGRKEPLKFDKITARIANLSKDLDIDPALVSLNVIKLMADGMTTRELDKLAYEEANSRNMMSLDYEVLASRIAWSDLHKSTPGKFSVVTLKFEDRLDIKYFKFVMDNIERIESEIDYSRDQRISLFGFKTLEKSYLWKKEGVIIERYQDLLMRVAIAVNVGDIEGAIKTYHVTSKGYYTHATATLYHAGHKKFQGSSCFLLTCGDSMDYITDCWKYCGMISKYAGGIGVDMTPVRGNGAVINGTNDGASKGIIPFIRTFERIAEAVDQGRKRNGAIVLSLQPWHPDTEDFLELRTNNGVEEKKARGIFIALFIPDIFFKRLNEAKSDNNTKWSYFCPYKYPELVTLFGNEFEERYLYLEREKLYERQVNFSDLWKKIVTSLTETGTPYMLSKDNINRLNNHCNIGTITSSNLCCEIVQYHDENNIAVCNLASLSLPMFIERLTYNFYKLGDVVELTTRNMNYIIDNSYLPIELANVTNKKQRSLGIGVQGLADVFAMLKYPWESENASILNRVIFEVIYFFSLKQSCELAKRDGRCDYFDGSPYSKGLLQFDRFKVFDEEKQDFVKKDIVVLTMKGLKGSSWIPKLDWERLREEIKEYGLRNSTFIAPMPTATTAQILGNNESIECYTSNLYVRNVMSGDFSIINKHMYHDLKEKGLWTKEIQKKITKNYGSIQSIQEIPQDIKEVYKTVWEIKQKVIVKQAYERAPFIDQSQSLNIHYEKPNMKILTNLYIDAWKNGLKTLSYYMRSKPASNPMQMCTDEVCVRCTS